MKALNIIAAYKPAVIYGGPTMSVAMLCEELNRAGLHTEVFTTTANGVEELPVSINKPVNVDGVTVTYFKRITKDHTHFSPALLKALWKRAKEFDVIHIHAWWNLVSVLSCAIALAKGVPVILSPRGTLSNYSFANNNTGKKRIIHALLGKKLLAKCHIHVTAARESVSILDVVKPLNITTIPNFVKLPTANVERPAVADGPIKLLFFSRIEEKKGLDILLQALNTVTIPFHVTIAGDGDITYINKLKASVTDPAITAKITWAGFYNDDKFILLSQHDLLVLPSHDENFGNVVIESLSVGTPVLISYNVGLANYVKDHNLGWICDTDAASVSDAINNMTDYNTKITEIQKKAPGIIRADFSGSRLQQQYINFYKDILAHERL
ncbi:glycosyltransferase [Mucilaginibacter sp. RB4R14]|uniref:XrtY-associated glycosyltransferase XYAG1 n=1 Tax=Mucilaginibacter aurantiaciroseus TaxID=2949308 RepID=UPI002090A482|nr:glycosyltransferase [Mucilaginibacter aurantiaciroseus]MCO5936051.1 glycosyltransferase [Mucilaginibacter aurantiaciroseus]